MDREITRHYSNGEVTIVWKNKLCIHCGNCARGLSGVFHPKESPWIQPDNATTEKIIEQVNKCPSGALTFLMNEESTQ